MRKRTLPWFVLAATLVIVSYFLHYGIPQGVMRSVGVLLFLGGCIRLVGLLIRDNPTGAEMANRRSIESGVAGLLADESAEHRRQRAAARRSRHDA